MKILLLDRYPGHTVQMPVPLTLVPDSALVTGNNPMFLADFSSRWEGQLFLAFRIGRLGKNIAVKFAQRYYDAVTVGLRAVAVDLENDLKSYAQGGGLAGAFDSGVALGEWQPVPPEGSYDIKAAGLEAVLYSHAVAIDAVVSAVSRYMTLKTGDVISAMHLGPRLPLTRDMIVSASIGEKKVLRIKIK